MTGARLVIGVGNRDRGDDALGPMVIDALARRRPTDAPNDRVDLAIIEGDLSSLPLRWTTAHEVVIVDAIVTGQPIGSVTTVDALAGGLEPSTGILSTHGIGLVDAIELGRLLDRLPASLTLIAVEAGRPDAGAFDLFAAPNPAISDLVPKLADVLASWAWPSNEACDLVDVLHRWTGATHLSS